MSFLQTRRLRIRDLQAARGISFYTADASTWGFRVLLTLGATSGGIPGGAGGKEPTRQRRRHKRRRFDP